jgi:RNA polymerase sigma factor (sigma-70 family)
MARFRRGRVPDTGACYELFRRALLEQDQEAWAAIYRQYERLVHSWVGPTQLDGDGLVNDAFRRFWQAMSPERFSTCPSLSALLAYLRHCARSALYDAIRRTERRQAAEMALDRWQALQDRPRSLTLSDNLLETIAGQQIQEYVLARLDAQEQLVFEASFEWHLKPRHIATEWPQLFSGAQEVSRIKERILRRLGRDDRLKSMLGYDLDGEKS